MARIEGLDECMRAFENAPQNMDKVIIKAMKAGFKPVVQQMKASSPKRFKSMVKSKVSVNGNNDVEGAAGYFNNKKYQGHQPKNGGKIPDWYKAYWLNYGTLQGRDPNHTFKTPVRSKHSVRSKNGTTRQNAQAKYRRNDVGVKHMDFFDGDVSHYSSTFMEAFTKSVNDQQNEILK